MEKRRKTCPRLMKRAPVLQSSRLEKTSGVHDSDDSKTGCRIEGERSGDITALDSCLPRYQFFTRKK